MNNVILIGNVTKDPEIRNTQTGKKIASFSLAVNEGKDKVQYFSCSAWEKLADILEAYVKKGTKVAVVGSLQNRSWEKPGGTKAYATDILIRELDILTSRKENSKNVETVNELPNIDDLDLNVQMPF